jgi:hypothetical protein
VFVFHIALLLRMVTMGKKVHQQNKMNKYLVVGPLWRINFAIKPTVNSHVESLAGAFCEEVKGGGYKAKQREVEKEKRKKGDTF